MPSAEDIERSQDQTEALSGGSGASATMASALGSAMLGLDQAIRCEPPAQVVAAEHQPQRSFSGDDDDLVIELPDLSDPNPSGTRDAEDG